MCTTLSFMAINIQNLNWWSFNLQRCITIPLTAVYIWRDLFWKYNTQCLCLVVEHVQIKLTKFGQQISSLSRPMSGWRTRRLAGWDSHDTERPFLVKFTRWVGKGMISAGEGMRHSNALLSGSDQFWLVLFGRAPQLNKGTECYIFKTGLSKCKQLEADRYFNLMLEIM